MIDEHRKSWASRRARSPTRKSCSAWSSLVNEGAHILEDGIASKSGDIDMVYLTGYGFPLWRGGPMHYAGEVGLFNVVQAMGALPEPQRRCRSGSPHRCWPSWPPKASSSARRGRSATKHPEQRTNMTSAVIVSTARTRWPRAGRALST
jgi:hypothetical protein